MQAALISYYYPVTWIYPALILAGGLTTLITKHKEVRHYSSHSRQLSSSGSKVIPGKGCRTISRVQP